MLGLLAAQPTEPIPMLLTAGLTAVLTLIGKDQYDRRRNNRRNNIENHRLTGNRRPSDCKPGLGDVCREHGRDIAAQGSALAGLAAYQETYQQQIAAIFKQLGTIQQAVTTLVARQKE